MREKWKLGFSSPEQMLNTILGDVDMYNKITGDYVFHYNNAGAIAVYKLTSEEADKLDSQSAESNEYWGAFLGVGGTIWDEPERASENEQECNLDYCKRVFNLDGWVDVSAYSSILDEVNNYLNRNGSDVINQIRTYEVDDIIYGYEYEEIPMKLDKLIESYRDYIKNLTPEQKIKICSLYNNSDIECFEYLLQFCDAEQEELLERLTTLHMETDIGYGREASTPEEIEEYYKGKWKLLNAFGIENRNGDAYYEGVPYDLEDKTDVKQKK